MKLLIHSQTSTIAPLKFVNKLVISSHAFLGTCLLIHAGIKVKSWGYHHYWINVIYLATIYRVAPQWVQSSIAPVREKDSLHIWLNFNRSKPQPTTEHNKARTMYTFHGSYCVLTHWGRVTHICVVKLTIISSDNGLSPGRCQAIIWTNAGIMLIGPLGTNFIEILIGIQTFSFNKMHLEMSSAKWRPFCLGLNVLSIRLCCQNPYWTLNEFDIYLFTISE